MPNRHGMTTQHGAGFGNAKPDVRAVACMSICATETAVASYLPERARSAHSNLTEQNRVIGAQHGADTTRAPGAMTLARKLNCLTCHGLDNKVVGPALREVSKKYAGRDDAAAYLARKINNGGSGKPGGA
jgi:S-disulfanyl-L-cysteine oxidoreductase SoxD